MASWCERLQQLNFEGESTKSLTIIEPLYIDAARWILKRLIFDIQNNYRNNELQTSNINFYTLSKRFKNNIDQVLEYMYNERNSPLIYEISNYMLDLYPLLEKYYATKPITASNLVEFYTYCANNLYGSSEYKTFLICDVRRQMLETILYDCEYTMLEVYMMLALLKRRHLYPLMEIIIICDESIIKSNIDITNTQTITATTTTTSKMTNETSEMEIVNVNANATTDQKATFIQQPLELTNFHLYNTFCVDIMEPNKIYAILKTTFEIFLSLVNTNDTIILNDYNGYILHSIQRNFRLNSLLNDRIDIS